MAQQTQKRTLLNKRVAFPVLGAGSTASSSPESNLSASGPPPLAAGPLGSAGLAFILFTKLRLILGAGS